MLQGTKEAMLTTHSCQNRAPSRQLDLLRERLRLRLPPSGSCLVCSASRDSLCLSRSRSRIRSRSCSISRSGRLSFSPCRSLLTTGSPSEVSTLNQTALFGTWRPHVGWCWCTRCRMAVQTHEQLLISCYSASGPCMQPLTSLPSRSPAHTQRHAQRNAPPPTMITKRRVL